MSFEIRIALRYLTSSRLQTGLILSLVAMGVLSFTFIAGLINGLADLLIEDIIGNLPHVYLEVPDSGPSLLPALAAKGEKSGREPLVAMERGEEPVRSIGGWRPLVARLETEPDLTAVLPVAGGNGLARRGPRVEPVLLLGVPPEKISAIVDIESNLIAGDSRLGPNETVIGSLLAKTLGVSVGRRVSVTSAAGATRSFTVQGIFETGGRNLDEGTMFLEISAAQSLLDLSGRVTRIEMQVRDVFEAPAIARRVSGATGLFATHWVDEASQLEEALRAQASTGTVVKAFSLLVVVIGVASALLLAATRRRSEVGIMRGLGFTKGAVMRIFVLQGAFLGLAGAAVGCLLGWVFGSLFVALSIRPDGSPSLPIDPAQGEYLRALALATIACTLASILPARSAARVDPVEVLAQ